jgi:polysaccharide biosynthesis protein PslG
MTTTSNPSGPQARLRLAGEGISIDAVSGDVSIPAASLASGLVLTFEANGASSDSYRLVVSTKQEQVAPSAAVTPTISGSGKIGEPLQVNVGTWEGEPAPETGVQWLRNSQPIQGAIGPTYVPVAADDLSDIACRITATNSAGTAEAQTASLRVTYQAPSARGTLSAQTFTAGTGVKTVATATFFSGSVLRFSLVSPPAGVTIDASSGVLSINTGLTATISGVNVRVRATNSGGQADQTMILTIVEPVPTVEQPYFYHEFETGTNAGTVGWHDSSALVTKPTLGGSHCVRVTGGTDGWGFQLGGLPNLSEIYLRQKLWLEVTKAPTAEFWAKVLQVGNEAQSFQIILNHVVRPNGTSAFVFWNGAANVQTAVSANVSRGRVLDVEIFVRVNANDGRIVLRVDGATLLDYTGNTGSQLLSRVQYLAQDTNIQGSAFAHYFDDLTADRRWSSGTVTAPSTPTAPVAPAGPVEPKTIEANGAATGLQSGSLGIAIPDNEMTHYDGLAWRVGQFASMGVRWCRFDMRVSSIQSSPSATRNWTSIDQRVNALSAAKINILGLLMPGGWLGESFATEANRVAMRNHCVAVVNRYKSVIKHWEICNELNLARKCTAQNYALLMQLVYPAIKAEDPEAQVGFVGNASVELTSSSHFGARPWLVDFYNAGGGRFFDFLCHHPYTATSTPTTAGSWQGWNIMAALYQEMVARGDGHKQIWITEYGDTTAGTWDNVVTEARQDSDFQQAYDICVRTPHYGPMFYYSHRDRPAGGDDNSSEQWFGLMRRNGTFKPAYNRFVTLAARDRQQQVARPTTGTYQYFAGRLFTTPGSANRTGVAYAITPRSGVTINQSTGIVTIASNASLGNVTVTATRNGGSAQATLTIVA